MSRILFLRGIVKLSEEFRRRALKARLPAAFCNQNALSTHQFHKHFIRQEKSPVCQTEMRFGAFQQS